MYLQNAREPKANTRRIELQSANQAPGDTLLVSLNAITRDDSGSREDEVRTERLDDRSRKDGGPISLLRGHGREDELRDQDGEGADGQDPLGRQAGDEPGGDEGGGGGADGDGGEADGGGEGGPVADFLLPGDEVPDEGGVGHEAEKDDDDEGEEGGGFEDGEWEDGVWGVFVLPDREGGEEDDGEDQEGDLVWRVPSCCGSLAGSG